MWLLTQVVNIQFHSEGWAALALGTEMTPAHHRFTRYMFLECFSVTGCATWCGRGGSRQAKGTGESGFHGEVGDVTWMCGVRWQGSVGCGGRGQRGAAVGVRGV